MLEADLLAKYMLLSGSTFSIIALLIGAPVSNAIALGIFVGVLLYCGARWRYRRSDTARVIKNSTITKERL